MTAETKTSITAWKRKMRASPNHRANAKKEKRKVRVGFKRSNIKIIGIPEREIIHQRNNSR